MPLVYCESHAYTVGNSLAKSEITFLYRFLETFSELILCLPFLSTFSTYPSQGSSLALSLFLVCSSLKLHQFPSKGEGISSLPLLFCIISILICFCNTVYTGIFMYQMCQLHLSVLKEHNHIIWLLFDFMPPW